MASPQNRLENLQTLRISNVDVAFATAFATLVTGTFLVGFIKMMGGSDLWIGLVSSLPSLLGILQIPGAIIGRRFGGYKKFVSFGGGTWRLMYVPVALLPLLPIAPELALTLLVICASVAAAATLFVNPIYNDWIAEMVPESSRGWYFSRRNAIATATGAAVGIVGALILDAFRKADLERYGFATIFGLGVVFAAISFVLFLRMKDIPRKNPVRENLMDGIRAVGKPFADREFRRVLIFLGLFFIGQSLGGNLYGAYALESLKLDFTLIQLFGVMNAAGMVLSTKLWGFLADRYRNKPVLMLAGTGIATNQIPWLLSQPGQDVQNAIVLLIGHLIMGLFWGGVALCQFNILLATAKPEDRANYLGAGMALQSVMAGASPMLGAFLMSQLRGSMDPVTAYKTVFVVVMILRFAAIFALIPVKEPGSARLGTTLRHLGRVTPGGVAALRRLTRSGNESERAEAIGRVAQTGNVLASEEIVKALQDPSPQVRRQAASALASLKDPDAAAALIREIEERPDLVEEETVHALGAIGGQGAVKPLINLLESPRSLLRRAAAKALGHLGSPEATDALIAAAAEVDDPDLRRSSIQALRTLGAREAAQVISDALFDPHPSVRIAAAEAAAEMEIRSAAPYLRQSLAYYADEAASEVAYALGRVGNLSDLPAILKLGAEMRSRPARRRCLLGIAAQLGVERDVYRLLSREGMDRDTVVMGLLRTKGRPQVQEALDLYSKGDETGALRVLAEMTQSPEIRALADHPMNESFLLAAVLIGNA